LTDIFSKLLEQQEGKEAINHKADEKELRQNFTTVVPNYDVDRVYLSDIRKVFQWYNLLLKEGLLVAESVVEATEDSTPESTKQVKKVKADAVKKAKVTTVKEPKTPKPAVSKKAPVIKTGSSRGK
jgi:hypothetical protein